MFDGLFQHALVRFTAGEKDAVQRLAEQTGDALHRLISSPQS